MIVLLWAAAWAAAMIVIMAAAFIILALLLEARTNARMRAFTARWAKLTEEERKEEIARVRAAREMLEAKRRTNTSSAPS